MYKSELLPLAKQDVKEASQWYNSQKKGLGKEFTKEVRERVLFIRKNTKASAVRYDKTHTHVLKAFPFMIHYSIDEANKTIVVSAVYHTSMSSKKWKKR